MSTSATVRNEKELLKKFKQLETVAQAHALSSAVHAGALPIQNEIVYRAPRLTGTYARDWHFEITRAETSYATGEIGNNTPYGPRLEFGFSGKDALGRTINQPAKPHVRPAFDQKRKEAIAEMSNALKAILEQIV